MRRRRWAVGVVSTVLVAVGLGVHGTVSNAFLFGSLPPASAGGRGVGPPLLELERCQTAGLAATGGAPGKVAVVVPATALLGVDTTGRVVAVTTNTGCAPRVGDDVFLVRPDGSMERVPSAEVADRGWIGDFRHPGAEVPQRG